MKNIILIMPKYFKYEKYIYEELKKKDCKVNLIYENLDDINWFYRIIYVYFPKLKKELLFKYYKKKIAKFSKIDGVLVIRGSSIDKKIINYIKSKVNHNVKFIMYQWDGINNNKNILEIVKYFDKIYTFDMIDAEKYGWEYRPLFFIPQLINTKQKKDIDMLFVCGLHSERYQILMKIKNICESNNLILKSNLTTNLIIFLKKKYLNKDPLYIKISEKDISFSNISLEETYDLYARSKIVIDYTHPNQNGLTMRTIEALGTRCKLITNNINIKKSDFYLEDNILLYKNEEIEVPKDFLDKKYIPINDKIYKRYSIENWIEDIFKEVL